MNKNIWGQYDFSSFVVSNKGPTSECKIRLAPNFFPVAKVANSYLKFKSQ